jgi:hypothetical protein
MYEVATMKYSIGSVKREKREGMPDLIKASLINEDGSVSIHGPLCEVIRICMERGYDVKNLEQARQALQKMTGETL